MKSTQMKMRVMAAYLDRKTIQIRRFGYPWLDMEDEPLWDWKNFNYRVKPEKMKNE